MYEFIEVNDNYQNPKLRLVEDAMHELHVNYNRCFVIVDGKVVATRGIDFEKATQIYNSVKE